MSRQDGRKLDHQTLEAIRLRAVARVHAGESPEAVIRSLGFSRSRIYAWLAAHRRAGRVGLQARRIPGRPCRLNDHQAIALCKTLVEKNPRDLKFDDALWSLEMIRALVERRFGARLSLPAVMRTLKRLGILNRTPRAFWFKRNSPAANRWLKRTRTQAQQSGARLIFIHETVSSSGIAVLIAVGPRGRKRFLFTKKPLVAEQFVEFLRRLLWRARRSIRLILREDVRHRSAAVASFLAESKNRLRLVCIPPDMGPAARPAKFLAPDNEPNCEPKNAVITPAWEAGLDSADHTRATGQW